MLGWTSKNTSIRRYWFCTTLLLSFTVVQLPLNFRPIYVHLLCGGHLPLCPGTSFAWSFLRKLCISFPYSFPPGVFFGSSTLDYPASPCPYCFLVVLLHLVHSRPHAEIQIYCIRRTDRMCAWCRLQMSLIAQNGSVISAVQVSTNSFKCKVMQLQITFPIELRMKMVIGLLYNVAACIQLFITASPCGRF